MGSVALERRIFERPGAAVAAGLVPFAIGSETWGLIVTPAALCGVTGLRPTYGRVSRHGAMALSWTMDKLGPLGRTAADCGVVLAAIAGRDPLDDSSLDDAFDWSPKTRQYRRNATGSRRLLERSIACSRKWRRTCELSSSRCRDIAAFDEVAFPEELPANTVADVIISAEVAAAFESLVRDGRIAEMTAEEDRWRIWSGPGDPGGGLHQRRCGYVS